MATENSSIRSGWRGTLNGAVSKTHSQIKVTEVTLKLDSETAWALANLLTDDAITKVGAVNPVQAEALSNLGAALGRLIDHGAANNGGRDVLL